MMSQAGDAAAPEVQAYLDKLIEAGIVGAVGLVDEGEVTLGAAGLAAVDGPSIEPDAIFRVQSMTKAVTAVATLRLVEQGRLELEHPVSRWLPELAEPLVLRTPESELADTVPAARPIVVRDLLTLMCGHGTDSTGSPYARAQEAAGVAAGVEPVALPADEWLTQLSTLPLAHQPGAGWRYHHGFMLLGILLGRLTMRPLGEHLAEDVFAPLGMTDTGFWASDPQRLVAAYRLTDEGPVEVEPAGAGFYAGDPGYNVDHSELVSTASDYLRFAQMLRARGRVGDKEFLQPESLAEMCRNQIPLEAESPQSFGDGFWHANGWGYGVSVADTGTFGWSGGYGTDFTIDPATGRITILMMQAELDATVMPLMFGFRDV